MLNRLMKSSKGKVLFGVCAGIADFFGINLLIVRVLFIFIPGSLVVYILLAALLKTDPSLY
ncbi:PspC domain-containing protein [Sporosarcina sp. Marseille-Q4063]|uniref:PspC domain-containing protein n=1 Tax=Sporosarcina sp. Marseille-Q4063 TaxID=2810514 RepID=UPI001BAF162F|nr:PspC domain-containing protein [Sporosarcina sp. Marseille-Q4063]QUW23147.1 PspC domain-containing protein [Sporosarcina sp. Marseille-Q4063]